MSKPLNGIAPLVPIVDVMDNMIGILENLDAKRFRAIVEASDDVADSEILEAMHRTRIEHPDIKRTLKNDSRRWLYRKLH